MTLSNVTDFATADENSLYRGKVYYKEKVNNMVLMRTEAKGLKQDNI